MLYSLSPLWLVLLYSIAGYTETEISKMTGWSLKAIKTGITEYGILESDRTRKGESVRKYIDAIREKDGNAAALHAVKKLMVEIAGPPIRMYR